VAGLTERRMFQVRKMLVNICLILAEIVDCVGYGYDAVPARAFRCRFGMFPTSLRRRT